MNVVRDIPDVVLQRIRDSLERRGDCLVSPLATNRESIRWMEHHQRRTVTTRRLAVVLRDGAFPERTVRRLCETPGCLNADHMQLHRAYHPEPHKRDRSASIKRWTKAELPSWDGAACRDADPSLFYDPGHVEASAVRTLRKRAASSYCANCVLSQRCLEFAVSEREVHGIWGGFDMSSRVERRMAHRSIQENAA